MIADDFDQHAFGFVVEEVVADVDLAVVILGDLLNGDELRFVDGRGRLSGALGRKNLARDGAVEQTQTWTEGNLLDLLDVRRSVMERLKISSVTVLDRDVDSLTLLFVDQCVYVLEE